MSVSVRMCPCVRVSTCKCELECVCMCRCVCLRVCAHVCAYVTVYVQSIYRREFIFMYTVVIIMRAV